MQSDCLEQSLLTAKDGGNAVRLSGTISAHAPELLRTKDPLIFGNFLWSVKVWAAI
ncbi:MAG: hypothetical protein HFP77_02320 [Methylococcales symbiont of Iophon sp. n. MRB-2018]|nr:MAG: hypothetical protein HFP77_02320 [Methylococcales symbiont of Iophon sp. n. MRB-2018]